MTVLIYLIMPLTFCEQNICCLANKAIMPSSSHDTASPTTSAATVSADGANVCNDEITTSGIAFY